MHSTASRHFLIWGFLCSCWDPWHGPPNGMPAFVIRMIQKRLRLGYFRVYHGIPINRNFHNLEKSSGYHKDISHLGFTSCMLMEKHEPWIRNFGSAWISHNFNWSPKPSVSRNSSTRLMNVPWHWLCHDHFYEDAIPVTQCSVVTLW